VKKKDIMKARKVPLKTEERAMLLLLSYNTSHGRKP